MQNSNVDWITTKELAEIKGISERAVRKSIAKNKYVIRKSSKSYEILVTSLEESVRKKITERQEKSTELVPINYVVPEEQKKLALAKYDLIKNWDKFRNEKTNKTQAGKDFLDAYNNNCLCKNLFVAIGKVAICTIYEWHKKLREYNDDWHSLINNYTFGAKTTKTLLTEAEKSELLKNLLHPNQLNIGKAIKYTKMALKSRGYENLCCDLTYRRFANNYKAEHYDVWVEAREGNKALHDKVLPYITRDVSKLEVGDVIIGDGHRLAFFVRNPYTGNPVRPTLVAYQDWKSGGFVGFEIMLEENTQCIASALRNSIINLGKVPRFVYQDNGNNKNIMVTDDGLGMTFDELNNSFLKIGRNRRKDSEEVTPKGRKVTGRKGLGKLAIFGIANEIEVRTVKNNLKNVFIMNLQEILSTDKEYSPKILIQNEKTDDLTGTTIILRDIQRKSAFDIEDIKASISKRFNFEDKEFCIELQKSGVESQRITSDTKWEYITPQFEWEFPEDDISKDQYALSKGITVKIISTEKPLGEHQNGIFLYARGKLVNSNDFFGLKTTTSFAYNYFTGFINVDFIDDYDKDMITTNRDGLTWENEELDSLKQWLKDQLFNIAREWRIKREESKTKEINDTTDINYEGWVKTMPIKLQSEVNSLVGIIIKDDDIDETKTKTFLKELKNIVPEYPYFHWRNLHPKIREVSAEYYAKGDYYNAFLEAAKNYKNAVKDKSRITENNDYKIMTSSFGLDKILKVTSKYKYRPNGQPYSPDTLSGIEEAQMFLSQGVVKGGRNIVSHEEISDLKISGLFTEKNCLDMLSILSHLYERLDDAEVKID